MSYCIHCGKPLREGVNFCEQCGAEVSRRAEGMVGDADVESDDEDNEPEVEDCDETPEKGPPSDCYATFEDREVTIYREDGCIYRRIHLHYEVLDASVSGDRVSITCEGGWHYIYSLDGMLIRSGRH